MAGGPGQGGPGHGGDGGGEGRGLPDHREASTGDLLSDPSPGGGNGGKGSLLGREGRGNKEMGLVQLDTTPSPRGEGSTRETNHRVARWYVGSANTRSTREAGPVVGGWGERPRQGWWAKRRVTEESTLRCQIFAHPLILLWGCTVTFISQVPMLTKRAEAILVGSVFTAA